MIFTLHVQNCRPPHVFPRFYIVVYADHNWQQLNEMFVWVHHCHFSWIFIFSLLQLTGFTWFFCHSLHCKWAIIICVRLCIVSSRFNEVNFTASLASAAHAGILLYVHTHNVQVCRVKRSLQCDIGQVCEVRCDWLVHLCDIAGTVAVNGVVLDDMRRSNEESVSL